MLLSSTPRTVSEWAEWGYENIASEGGSRIPGCILLVLMFAPGVLAQEASVIHSVNLRPNPATTNTAIEPVQNNASRDFIGAGT